MTVAARVETNMRVNVAKDCACVVLAVAAAGTSAPRLDRHRLQMVDGGEVDSDRVTVTVTVGREDSSDEQMSAGIDRADASGFPAARKNAADLDIFSPREPEKIRSVPGS